MSIRESVLNVGQLCQCFVHFAQYEASRAIRHILSGCPVYVQRYGFAIVRLK